MNVLFAKRYSRAYFHIYILQYKSSMQLVLNKNLEFVRGGRFSLKFDKGGVKIFSMTDCHGEHQLVDAVDAVDNGKYNKNALTEGYLSYLVFSLNDPYGVKSKKLIGYYICVLENDDVTTFAFTGGPNSRGGGPIYLINNKTNKLLEVHYMQ